MDTTKDWKTKTLVLGALVGTAAGILGAYMLIQRAEQNQQQPRLSTGEGVKLGLSLLGVLKLVSEFADRK